MNTRQTLRPERSDAFFMKEVLQAAFNARIGLVSVSLIALSLMAAIIVLSSRPQRVIVIDGGSGRTYSSVSHTGMNEDLIQRQLCYYSVVFVEDYFNYDYLTIQNARRNIIDLGHPQFVESLGKDYLNNADVKKCYDEKAQSFFSWEINPKVTMRNDPYYSTFMTFQRVIKTNDVTREMKKYNVKLDWGRLGKNADYTKRPHSLVLLRITILNEGSTELNDQINKLN